MGMSIRRSNPEDGPAPLVFYHGAQRWEGPPSIVAHRKGRAEHGAGIYLTTSWERASSYAKGGGSVYRFEVSPDVRWLEDARLPAAETVRWVKSLPRLKGKADIVASLERTAGRVGPSIPAEVLVAPFVNFGASSGANGVALTEYLVQHGVDVSHARNVHDEDWVVVFNPAKVLRVTRLPAKDRGEGFVYDLPRVRRNPEDGPTRIRLSGFSTVRKMSLEVEAFLRDLYDASYPNALSSDPSSRILANAKARVEVTPMHGGVHIDELEAGSRGQGAGTEALRFLTGLADKHGISLFLQAHPFGDERMSLEALERFYRRHGFRPDDEEDNDDEATHMHRWPRQTNPREPLRSNPARKPSQTDTVTSSAAFRRWFGASKVVNAKGEPRVMYHGTHADFDVFDTTGGRRARSFGAMFTPSKAYAANYGRKEYGGKVLAVYLRIENPLDAKNKKHDREWEANRLPQEGWVQYAHRAGYDGAITMLNEYVVFDPTQVKSANMNAGTFDPTDPSILRNPASRNPASRNPASRNPASRNPASRNPASRNPARKVKTEAVKRARAGEKNLRDADLSGANLRGADLTGADLRDANLQRANLADANLEGADLRGALLGGRFQGANLSHANLTGVDIALEDLSGVNLVGANLSGANLFAAKLRRANLAGANLSGANLESAYLEGTIFSGANLSGANMVEVRYDANTRWADDPDARPLWEHLTVPDPRGSAAFRRWFGKSVTVDETGRPLVLYHGTSSGGFDTFDLAKIDPHQHGFYFTPSLSLANSYGGPKHGRVFDPAMGTSSQGAYRVFLKLERPFVHDAKGGKWSLLRVREFPGLSKTHEVVAAVKATGKYDGVVFKNLEDTGSEGRTLEWADVYAVFDPKQIKSATANAGTFDPADPSILRNPASRNPARKAKPPTLAAAGLPEVWFHGTQKAFPRLKAQGGACVWLADKAGAMAYATPSYGRRSAIRLIEVTLSPDTRVVDLADASDPAVRSFIHLDASVSNLRWHGREDVTDAEMADAVARWNARRTHYDAIEARPWAKAHFRKAGADALLVRDVAGWGGHAEMPSLCLLNAKKALGERDVAPDLALVRPENMPKYENPRSRIVRHKVPR